MACKDECCGQKNVAATQGRQRPWGRGDGSQVSKQGQSWCEVIELKMSMALWEAEEETIWWEQEMMEGNRKMSADTGAWQAVFEQGNISKPQSRREYLQHILSDKRHISDI